MAALLALLSAAFEAPSLTLTTPNSKDTCGSLQNCTLTCPQVCNITIAPGVYTYSDNNCEVDFHGKQIQIQGSGAGLTIIDVYA